MTPDELVRPAMDIILAAGDARDGVYKAIAAATEGDYASATALLDAAQSDIQRAHRVHTAHIQGEASGEATPYSLLFTHAQDTLMTAYSEFRLMKKVMPLLAAFHDRLTALEES